MSDSLFLILFAIGFPLFWTLIGSILALASGWFTLRDAYPQTGERPLRTLHCVSGWMGIGVSFNGCLTLSACPSGLRVAIWPIFGPFNGRFEPPWSEIAAVPNQSALFPRVTLTFGDPQVGSLRISARAWEQLLAARGLPVVEAR